VTQLSFDHEPNPSAPVDATDLRAYADSLLKASLGPDASFRDGQWEAIEALVTGRERLLVVQRTGWGKSSVYFLTTRLLRERGAGPTILISPLLALMRDQIRAAERLGVRAATINSTNTEDWDSVIDQVHAGEVDILLVSPERLASSRFRRALIEPLLGEVGMLVVDEAHCISDWGHDFRPDYRRIRSLLPQLGPNAAVLATTATANEAVAQDVVAQLGGNVRTMRGPLSRASLGLQTIHIPAEHDRMAWLAEHLPQIDGSGIVYVLTKAHARRVAEFLTAHGIDAQHYTGGGAPGGRDEQRKLKVEQRLLANEIKAVVATPALGMGFDKPDLAFVIHFQMPQSLIHYYQQVGRAGRAVDHALGVLLYGEVDKRITDYFIAQAFPPEAVYASVLGAVGGTGLSVTEIAKRAKVGRALTEKVLAQLSVELPSPVVKAGSQWRSTGEPFTLDREHFATLTARRHAEQDRIWQYTRGARCLMAYIADELDDPTAGDCGKCAVCLGQPLISEHVDSALAEEAEGFTTTTTRPKRRGRTRKAPDMGTARVKRAKRKRGPKA
jgi:ATP-dependent DNA helicase RecQ